MDGENNMGIDNSKVSNIRKSEKYNLNMPSFGGGLGIGIGSGVSIQLCYLKCRII